MISIRWMNIRKYKPRHWISWKKFLLLSLFCVLGFLFTRPEIPSLYDDRSEEVLNDTILPPFINRTCNKNGLLTDTNGLERTHVIHYSLSPDPNYHYEFRYEFQNLKSSKSRLILLLTGLYSGTTIWWELSTGQRIISSMRSLDYSILTISSKRQTYDVNIPIENNLDIKWIYLSLQKWMNEIYYRKFRHYPRLYLYGVSRGSRFAVLLSRVLPVQAQILYVPTTKGQGFFNRSDYDLPMRTRLTVDPVFSSWFYFHYCYFNTKSNVLNDLCPFQRSYFNQNINNSHSRKNYFSPVPPTYFVLFARDHMSNATKYRKLITDIRNDSVHLGGTLLNHSDALKLYVVQPLQVTPSYMQQYFDKWACKPSSSKIFYEHFLNRRQFKAKNRTLETCFCLRTDFTYFERFPNITKTWTREKQEDYRDYVADINRFKRSFCEDVCGDLGAFHSMASRNIENTLLWAKDMDLIRHSLRIKDFISRPLRIWMYDKYSLLPNSKYLSYQTADKKSCGRDYQTFQMYSPEYFLQDYFRNLNASREKPLHNLIWANNPLTADYFIIPNDYTCIYQYYYRPNMTNSEYKALHIRLNTKYFIPLMYNIRIAFLYWSMSSGSNHIIPFANEKNMGVIDSSKTQNILKYAIQLGLTGFRQDLLPPNSSPLYLRTYWDVTTIYRHGYDIVIPAFNKVQFTGKEPISVDSNEEYKKKKRLFFFAGTINHSISSQSARIRLFSLAKDIQRGKIQKKIMMIEGKKFQTLTLINGHISPEIYVDYIQSTIFNIFPEGFSPWSTHLYESIDLGAIPLIIADSIVLPFERFIDWRSFTAKINVTNVRNMIDFVITRTKGKFEEYVKTKLENVKLYSTIFRWPYSSLDNEHTKHIFLPEEDLDGTSKNVFHYLSLELRCRRLEQLYGLTSDSSSVKSIEVQRQVCKNHPTICPCQNDQRRIAFHEYI